MRCRFRCMTSFSFLALSSLGFASAESPKVEPDLAGYRTVETAANVSNARAAARSDDSDSPAYLGILLDPNARQDLLIADVDPDSPASRAGVKAGDVLRKLDGEVIKDGERLLEVLRNKSAGEVLDLALSRQDKPVDARAILTPWSRPRPAQARPRVGLGVRVSTGKEGEGVTIEQVAPALPRTVPGSRSARSSSRSTTSR